MHKTLAQAFLDLSLTLPIDDKSVKDRLSRAYDILTKGGYEVHQINKDIYRVEKLSTSLFSDESVRYTISLSGKSCNCPDFPTARAGLCKHRLAVMMQQLMHKGA